MPPDPARHADVVAARGGASRRRCRAATCARRPIGWPRRVADGQRRTAGARAARRRRRARPRRRASSATPAGSPSAWSIASDICRAQLATHARRITEAYEEYSQLRVLKRPLEGVYLSLFLMMTLMILVSATWMGLYLAKRITRPVSVLAAGAREIGAGHLDHRIEPETRDEFGSLVEAFNTMAGELAASQRKLERLAARSGAQEPRARRAPPLHRDRARADRDRRGLARRGRPHRDDQQRRAAAARRRPRRRSARRPTQCSAREDLRRSSRCCARRGSGAAPAAGPGDRAGARRARAAPGRRRHAAARRGRQLRRRGAGVRRRDAADPDAARRGVARRGAPARARDQEPADADPAVRRAHAAPLRHGAAGRPARWSTSARRRSSARSSRSRSWSTSSRSSRACRRRARCRPI